MTTSQCVFPLTRDEEELTTTKDTHLGRLTTRYLHPTVPVISTFITDWQTELIYIGQPKENWVGFKYIKSPYDGKRTYRSHPESVLLVVLTMGREHTGLGETLA
jgi:hypothetical protein